MASQVEIRGQVTAAQTRRLDRLDTSGRPLPPHPREESRTQPQLLSRQEIDAINEKLLAAGHTIETTRERLFETRFVADHALQELEQERHIRQQCSEAYKQANIQYGKKAGEVHEMAAKCTLLQQQLEESRMRSFKYEFAFEESEDSIASGNLLLDARFKDVQRKTSELQTALDRIQGLEKEVNRAVARECLAKKRVDELEEERTHLNIDLQRFDGQDGEREHLRLALQSIHDLEEEREQVAQKNCAKINEMIAHAALVEHEFEEQRQTIRQLTHDLQAATTISTVRLNNADNNRGTKRAANLRHRRPSKNRKCKDASTLEEESTFVVHD